MTSFLFLFFVSFFLFVVLIFIVSVHIFFYIFVFFFFFFFLYFFCFFFFFFSSRRRHTRWPRDWSSDVCSSDLPRVGRAARSDLVVLSGRRQSLRCLRQLPTAAARVCRGRSERCDPVPARRSCQPPKLNRKRGVRRFLFAAFLPPGTAGARLGIRPKQER